MRDAGGNGKQMASLDGGRRGEGRQETKKDERGQNVRRRMRRGGRRDYRGRRERK